MEAEEVTLKLRVLKRTFDLLSGTAKPMSDDQQKVARMKIIQGKYLPAATLGRFPQMAL